MNVWPSASRLASSSRCLQPARLAVSKCPGVIAQPSSSFGASTRRHNSSRPFGAAIYEETVHASSTGPGRSGSSVNKAATSGKKGNASGAGAAVQSQSRPLTRRRRARERQREKSVSSSEKPSHKPSTNENGKNKSKSSELFSSKGNATTASIFDLNKTLEKLMQDHQIVPQDADAELESSQLPSLIAQEPRHNPPHDSPQEVLRENISKLDVEHVLTDVAPISQHNPVDTLAHGLDRVLFNPGVHWLRDPRSHVYNFTPWLEKIPKVNNFAFERLIGFISSSRDDDLRALAKQEGKKFAGSTSSLSGMMSHIYFLLSEYKEADCTILSQHFKTEATGFTAGQRMPAIVKLNYKDGIYAIDSHTADYDDSDKNVLTWMGTLLENFLTKTPEQFRKFMRFEAAPENTSPPLREAYRFAKSNSMVMRSQLDCHDPRLPGTGVFDIKTRACVTVRMDILNYQENAGYMITAQHGVLESFEKEYYDLIRSAFLKYNFQVRIGNMDGVMVAYHNTERIFGFQYISRDEMDERLFGATPGIGDKVFNHTVAILEACLEEAAKCFPEQSVICGFETRLPGKILDIFVQPAEWVGDEEQRPLKKLAVTLEHKLDGEPTRAANAMRATDAKWTVEYRVARVTIPEWEIRADYKFFMQRKKRSLILPSDVTLEQAEEYWTNLTYSNKIPEEKAKLFRPEAFAVAGAAIEKYREISRKGRLLAQEMEQRLAGQPKILLGHGIYEEKESLYLKDPVHERHAKEFESVAKSPIEPQETTVKEG
ncbi:hypothetical protein D9613_006069 [Agrocybe pediades]|uniref:Pet127-domain-containing protein n=1 Tax=Agrocybe pediades TaxID=84607 RepID=A0A8H4QWC7_9AGAR|nr:hypothetical protein D9613_006069 [Agrocybe pediades]